MLARVAARFKAGEEREREKEREKKMEKNKLLKFEHIVLLSTSNFESSFREISTKGEERKRRERKKKKKKKKK